MTTPTITLAVGQLWREVDPRFMRVIKILAIATTTERRCIKIATVDPVTNSTGRATWADKDRFNGKRGGYALVGPA